MTTQKSRTETAARSDLISLGIVCSHLALIYAPVYMAAWLGPSPLWIVFWIWFGTLHNSSLNLMHECAHLHVFKSRRGSQLLANWVLGPSMFVGFDRYREVHFAHHTNLGMQDDPKYSYKINIRGRKFVAFVLRSLILVEAFRKLSYVQGGTERAKKVHHGYAWLLRTLAVQLLALISLALVALVGHGATAPARAALDGVFAYGFIYIYGLSSLTIMFANLRAIAEHQPSRHQTELAGAAALRNLKYNFLSWLIFGSYGFADHATHHWEPGLPYYLLRERTREIAAEHPTAAPTDGYSHMLANAIFSDGSRAALQVEHPRP